MATIKSIDHVERGIRKLLSQYRHVPQVVAWLTSYLEWIQKLEDGVFEVIEKRTIDGEGAILDTIGKIVDLGRGAFNRDATNNDDYRSGLIIQIKALRSRGKSPDLEELLALLTMLLGGEWTLETRPPARIRVTLTGLTYDPNMVASALPFAKAAGVALTLLFSDAEASNVFRWSRTGTRTQGSSAGYSNGVWITPLYQ